MGHRYGGGIHGQLERAAAIRCPVQFHYAEQDNNIPLSAVEQVRAALPAPRHELDFLAAIVRSRRLHGNWVTAPSSAALNLFLATIYVQL